MILRTQNTPTALTALRDYLDALRMRPIGLEVTTLGDQLRVTIHDLEPHPPENTRAIRAENLAFLREAGEHPTRIQKRLGLSQRTIERSAA